VHPTRFRRGRFVLIHSPLVGPFTWSAVADELGARGVSVALPTLPENRPAPYWRHDAEAVAAEVADVGGPLVLVGHSGACPLLPAIGTAVDGAISAYVLVDGDLPLAPGSGGSRIDLLRAASPTLADGLEALLTAGGSFPTWGDEDLVEEIPDQRLRARVVAEVRPQPRHFWTEDLPAIPGWPDAPCGYLELSPHYAAASARAREQGWRYHHLRGGHFEMLVRPADVADAVLELAGEKHSR
jgi:Alpha/beta hydrolase family